MSQIYDTRHSAKPYSAPGPSMNTPRISDTSPFQLQSEVRGTGLLNNYIPEAHTGHESTMTVPEQQAAMPSSGLSSSAASAAGPIQAAGKAEEKQKAQHDAVTMEVAFNNNVFNPAFDHHTDGSEENDRGKALFEDTARNTSRRGVRAVRKKVREAQKKYERQKKGIYTADEIAGGWDDPHNDPRKFRDEKDRELLMYLNMEQALNAVRKGKTYSVKKNLSDF